MYAHADVGKLYFTIIHGNKIARNIHIVGVSEL
jgi:hypothetical protein